MPWGGSWVHNASGGVFCRIARADSGLRAPQRRRFSTTSFRPFTGSALARKSVRPGLLAKRVPVRDPWLTQHLQHLRLIAVPIRVHCSAHGTRVLRQDQDSGGLPYPASDLGSRNPSSNPDSNPDSNLDRNPYPAPSSKSAPCVAGRGLAFVEGRSAMRFNLSIQAIGLIGQIEKIEKIGIRKIPGRSESRYC